METFTPNCNDIFTMDFSHSYLWFECNNIISKKNGCIYFLAVVNDDHKPMGSTFVLLFGEGKVASQITIATFAYSVCVTMVGSLVLMCSVIAPTNT